MPVLINFKICDNSVDCSGIAVCPTKALYWDSKKKTIGIDNSKCISCGKCVPACPVDAIHVAKNDKEYKKLKKEIDEDKRKVSDLFIDRYGAQPIHPAFSIPQSDFDVQILQSTKPAVVELYNHDSIQCMLFSIPVKDLFEGRDIKYRKILADSSLLKKYKVSKLPAILFFNNGKLIGKIEGYFSTDKKDDLTKKIKKIFHG